jgi:hypothetical protein
MGSTRETTSYRTTSLQSVPNLSAGLFLLMVAPLALQAACLDGPRGGSADGEPGAALASSESELRRNACASTAECAAGQRCTTEDGACKRPPGCGPKDICPAVCYGVCKPDRAACGPTRCGPGEVCCNESCGICTPPRGVCTQQVCEPPPPGACGADADCRTFSDYCTGCDCRALAVTDPDPVCPGPGVQCLIDPCFNKAAFCSAGTCALRDAP